MWESKLDITYNGNVLQTDCELLEALSTDNELSIVLREDSEDIWVHTEIIKVDRCYAKYYSIANIPIPKEDHEFEEFCNNIKHSLRVRRSTERFQIYCVDDKGFESTIRSFDDLMSAIKDTKEICARAYKGECEF